MNRKIVILGIMCLLLSFLIATVVTAVSVWEQVGGNGFGDVMADEVSALAAFNGHLYAGTSNPTNDARIFRSADGTTWNPVIDPGFGSDHDTAPRAILDMMVFNGRLYASTGRGNAAQIWRTVDGLNWARVVNAGFGDPDIVNITALIEYNGQIYAGATHSVTGAQIWRSYTGDSNSWTQVAPSTAGTTAASIPGFAIFDGALYAAVELEDGSPIQIWQSYGGSWTAVVTNGFGDSNVQFAGGLAAFGGYLYAGVGNAAEGAQLWRSNDGTVWTPIINPGFGAANNQKIDMVISSPNQLTVSVRNMNTGIEIWRSSDGTAWEQLNVDGFGDSHNSGTNWSNAATMFLSQLYVGTTNDIDGGELWRMKPPNGVTLSPDSFLSGTAGQTITYSVWISNTGSTSDTYSLTASGNMWMTVTSHSSITLDSESSGSFTVDVTIPANALNGAVDQVIVTATSQADESVTDSTTLTTSCANLTQKVFLPVILRKP